MPFPEDAIASLICVQNVTAKKPTKQSDEKNPKMITKRQNKKEWERARESEVFAQRFVLAEHEVRQLQTEGTELNFHYCAPSRGARALPWTARRGGHSRTPATDHTNCILAKGLVIWRRHYSVCPVQAGFLLKCSCCHPRCWLVSCWEKVEEEEGRRQHLRMCHTLMDSLVGLLKVPWNCGILKGCLRLWSWSGNWLEKRFKQRTPRSSELWGCTC